MINSNINMETYSYTLDEFVGLIQDNLTINGALPCILPNDAIERLVSTMYLKWYYQYSNKSTQKGYYYIPKKNFYKHESSNISTILPNDIKSVFKIFPVSNPSLFSLGAISPNMEINIDMTQQPMLTSYMTSIGELGIYKTIIDGFSDVMNKQSKHTYSFDYNTQSKQLMVLTQIMYDIVIGCYVNIPAEYVFADQDFLKYCVANCRIELANLISMFDVPLPGGIKINSESIRARGEKELEEFMLDMKRYPSTGFLIQK